MATGEVLLISNRGDDQEFIGEVAKAASADLVHVPEPAEAVKKMAEKKYLAVFVDVTEASHMRAFEEQVQEQLGVFSDLANPNFIYLMGDDDLSVNRELITSPLFSNYFRRPTTQVEEIAKSYGRYIKASANAPNHQLGQFLGPAGKVQKLVLNHTQQKQEAVEAVRQYIIAAQIPPRIANLIANSTDELLMNALFDAPCDEFGRTLYSVTDRNEKRALEQNELITMSLGFDGVNLGLSVSDPFGSVDRNRLLGHLAESYRRKEYQLRTGQAGAGLGIATIFSTGGSLIYHVEPKIKTEATLLYRAYPNYRTFRQQFKFFSARFFG
jgi:hypothetical protein